MNLVHLACESRVDFLIFVAKRKNFTKKPKNFAKKILLIKIKFLTLYHETKRKQDYSL